MGSGSRLTLCLGPESSRRERSSTLQQTTFKSLTQKSAQPNCRQQRTALEAATAAQPYGGNRS